MTNETQELAVTETNLIWGHCPGCEEPIEKDDLFCGQCGIDIVWAATHCTKCKHPRHENDLYCTQCGKGLPE